MRLRDCFRKRPIVLVFVWILLLALSLSFLAVLESFFAHNPQGETISSQSWAGYIISKANDPSLRVIAINGSWTVPLVNASTGAEYSSIWIGVGGQLDKTLIQAGTEQDNFNGSTSYYAWYELLPSYSVKLDAISVSPGDQIAASLRLVDLATNRWNIQISDQTTGQYFGTTVAYNSTGSSGEWMLERPTVNSKLTTLADFRGVGFHGCHITSDSLSGTMKSFYYNRIEMTDGSNKALTSVSDLAADGTSFSVSYLK